MCIRDRVRSALMHHGARCALAGKRFPLEGSRAAHDPVSRAPLNVAHERALAYPPLTRVMWLHRVRGVCGARAGRGACGEGAWHRVGRR
eukprot:6934819-Prymnesium_polylepis.1